MNTQLRGFWKCAQAYGLRERCPPTKSALLQKLEEQVTEIAITMFVGSLDTSSHCNERNTFLPPISKMLSLLCLSGAKALFQF